MKKLFYSLIALVLVTSCNMQPKYEIKGNINGLDAGSAVLKKVVDGNLETVDSVAIVKGAFVFKGSVEMPEFYVITFADTLDAVSLFLENAKIGITADVDSIQANVVTGSELTTVYKGFNDILKNNRLKFRALQNDYMQANMSQNMEKLKEIEDEYTKAEDEQLLFIKGFVAEQSSSVIAPFVTLNFLMSYVELNELDSIVAKFSPEINASVYVQELTKKVNVLKKVAIGQAFVDFTLNDTTGNPLALSTVAAGKYTLIDFWAGWCNPCRQENPVLVEAYAKYKAKGFEIFGVSLDKTKESWVNAIKTDGITWPQVSDLKYWNCAARELYGFNSIPHNVLLDKDGIIVAKNLRGDELGAKLEELLVK